MTKKVEKRTTGSRERKGWNLTEKIRVRRMMLDGKSNEFIALEIGRSVDSIRYKRSAWQTGRETPPVMPEDGKKPKLVKPAPKVEKKASPSLPDKPKFVDIDELLSRVNRLEGTVNALAETNRELVRRIQRLEDIELSRRAG